jgi:hypothetical protein
MQEFACNIATSKNVKTKRFALEDAALKHIRWVILVSPWFVSVDCVNVNMSNLSTVHISK